MVKRFLVAVDLEGVHGVVGVPYDSLHTGKPDYEKAIKNAEKEVNAVVKGLFDGGAELVAVWDNHWKGENMNFSNLDGRIIRVSNTPRPRYERISFAKNYNFDAMLLVGYHAKEGSVGGVLAHSYSSIAIQYYKINGKQVGEVDIDSFVAAEHGFATVFVSSDDVCVAQAKEIYPDMETVVTKYGKGRNSADFRDEREVLDEMYKKAKECVLLSLQPKKLAYPAKLEMRFTRTEDALKRLERVRGFGIDAHFGEDAHIIEATLNSIVDLESFI